MGATQPLADRLLITPKGPQMKVLSTALCFVVLGLYAHIAMPQSAPPTAHFVGSQACKSCHAKQFDGWKQTRMANVVRDPKAHPEAVMGDFAHPDPTRTFTLDDVAFVYGSRYKQR